MLNGRVSEKLEKSITLEGIVTVNSNPTINALGIGGRASWKPEAPSNTEGIITFGSKQLIHTLQNSSI